MNFEIYQIGAGGTGAWAARALAYGLCNMRALDDNRIIWNIYDPDSIEEKNQLRQLFVGADAVGEYKVDYTVKVLKQIFAAYESYHSAGLSVDVTGLTDLIVEPEDIPPLKAIKEGQAYPSNFIIFLAVDNTFTRNKFEKFFNEHREACKSLMLGSGKNFYIDVGNTDKSWIMMCLRPSAVPLVKYDELTLPDSLISCADREETTSVPQTTRMNAESGLRASNAILQAILERKFKGEIAVYEELDHRGKKQIEALKVYTKGKHLIAAINDVSEVNIDRTFL